MTKSSKARDCRFAEETAKRSEFSRLFSKLWIQNFASIRLNLQSLLKTRNPNWFNRLTWHILYYTVLCICWYYYYAVDKIESRIYKNINSNNLHDNTSRLLSHCVKWSPARQTHTHIYYYYTCRSMDGSDHTCYRCVKVVVDNNLRLN